MRYEDASQSGALQGSQPIANDDLDSLAAGSRSSATGNLITGEGTQTGSAGADVAAGAHITAIAGKSGEDTSFASGKLAVTGEHGKLSVDAEGNYIYQANSGVENVRDRFTYTLADNNGATDTGSLIVEIGKTPVVIKAGAQQIVPGPDGVVTLPPGVELSDVRVVGRNLVIDMPDGTQLIIIDGAIFVPQLVLGGVEVPSTNLAALLIGQEPQPAAGEAPQSSGGNFDVPVPPLDPGVPLGDLIPPTEYTYTPPEPQETLLPDDEEPTIQIQPDGQPASVAAVDVVDEDGLPTRNEGEPEGSDEGADGNPSNNSDTDETTAGTILIDSPDGVDSVTINGVLVTGVIGQVIPGEYGTLTITGFNGQNILYSYTLLDNTSGDNTHDDFSVTITDDDGDQATATLTIDIIDDVPTARDDTDAVVKGDSSTDGNVMTGVGTTSAPGGVDTVGADNAEVTGVHAGTSGSFTNVPDGGVVILGQFGDLTLFPDGSYTYALHEDVGDGGNDVFTYQLTDGDGDTSDATLTIAVPPDLEPTVDAPNVGEAGTIVDEAGLPARPGEPGEPEGSGEEAAPGVNGDTSEITTGTINFTPGDTPATVTINGVVVTGIGQTFAGDYGTLTITGFNANGTINYSYVLEDNVDHDTDLTPFEEFNVVVTDVDGDSASDTLRIDIVDDVPTARPDTDDVGIGGFFASGNVVTDAALTDNLDSDDGADTVGADDATVTFIDSVNAAPGANVPDGGFVDIAGQYGVLRIYSNGDYTYTRDPQSGGGVEDVFNYTITDGDGDTSTTTLTITIPDTPIAVQFSTGVTMDDDALPGGNPGGVGDQDPDSSNTAGILDVQGGDGTLTFALRDIGAPPGFTYELAPNGDLLIKQGAVTVVTVTLDPATGAYTFTQNAPIDHTAGGDENDSFFNITVRVTDADGDFAEGSTILTIDDDTPELSQVVSQGDVTLDETSAGSPAGFPISDTSALPIIDFTAAFGADGAAVVDSQVFGLALTGGPGSGLQTAVGDFAITLVQIDGDTIEGHYNGSNVAFIIQMNGDGTVTLTQNVPLEHLDDGGPGPAHNDALDLGGLIAATVTITDGDGDETSAQVGIGDNLQFLDDGPNAQVDEEATLDQLVLDETTPPGTETDGDSNPPGLTQTTANFANNFVGPVDYGADGPGTVAYSLTLSANGIGSGLYVIDPSDISAGDGDGYGRGAEITLSINPAGTLITGSQGGNDYFTISIDPVTGVVTFTQLDNIWHANTGSDDDTSTLTTASPANVQVVQTVTDSDGDFDSAGINVGAGVFQIEDDGPVATNDVDEIVSGGDSAVGNVITGVGTNAGAANADDVGADTPGRVTQISGFGGSDNVFTAGLLEVDGQFGTLTIAANGSYTYTRFDGAPGNSQDVFTYTLTDADGDSTTATLTINIGDAAPNLPDPALIRLDDDVIPGANGNLNGPGDDDPDAVPGNVVNGQLSGSGGDGALTYNFTGDDTLPAGFSIGAASDADTLIIVQDQNGSPVTVMTIQLDQSDGSFTVTQNAPMWHPADNGGPDDNIENNFNFSIGVEVEDADNDVEPAHITINVDDDTPTIDVTKGSDSAVNLTTDDAQTIDVNSDTAVSTANFSGVFGLTQSAGADGTNAAATLLYTLDVTGFVDGGPGGVNSNLESHNVDIFLYEIGGKVVGSTSATLAGVNVGNTVFDVGVNGSGVVTLTQYQQIDHDTADPTPGGSPFADHIVSLTDSLITLTASASLTDKDGDTVTDSEVVNIGANLHFTDDGPTAAVNGTAPLDTIVLDETRPVTTDTPGGSAPAGLASSTANFADNFAAVTNFGADGPGTAAYSLFLSANGVASGLFALQPSDISTGDGDGYGQGASITLSINGAGTLITGSAGGTDYFTISINTSTGVVTFTQLNPIWHPTAPSNFDEAATLSTAAAANVQVVQTVTDFDGDTASASINVGQNVFSIQDDGPQAIQPDSATLENEVGATTTADLDDDGEVITDFGEDGPGLVQFANIANGDDSGFTSGTDAIEYWLSNNGQTLQGRTNSTNGIDGELVFTVQINQATGDYTVTMAGTIDNGAGISFDDLTSSAAGNVEFRGVGADDPLTTVDLLLSAGPAGGVTVNTDSDSIGAANQSMDNGETVRIDFVTNLTTDTGDPDTPPSGFNYGAHVSSSEFLGLIPQVQGSQSETVAFTVWALDSANTDATAPDRNPAGGFSDASITTITDVTVQDYLSGNTTTVDVTGFVVGTFTAVAYGISVRVNADGSVTFSGIQQGDHYGFTTDGGDFNAIAVQAQPAGTGGSSEDSFDLGIFAIGQVDTGDPINLSYDLKITDADGDTVTMTDAINITVDPATDAFAATTFSSLSSQSQSEQLQKTAANSNTLTLAAAVAAAGVVETQAAAAPAHDNGNHGRQFEDGSSGKHADAAASSSEHDSGISAVSDEAPVAANDPAPAASSSHSSDASADSGHSLDDSSASAAAQSSDAPAADNDQGPAAAVAAVAPAPTVAMVSAEALKAAGVDGDAQHNGSVEQVVADALGQGNAPAAVDALLNALPGGNGALAALAKVASPAAGDVSAWDMAGHGASAHGADMLMNVHAAMQHHDAVQPVVNG